MNIGLYGGTFSPPHKAHVRAAKLFIKEARLDKLYVMPAGIPPHKTADKWGDAGHRLMMSHLAFGDLAEISEYEINKEGKSYTVETLRYLKKLHPEDSLYMLVGEDMFLSLESWYLPEEIMSLCTVCTVRRSRICVDVMEDAAKRYREKYAAQIIIMEDEPVCVSSTDIREELSQSSRSDAIPEAVNEYIRKHGLYRNGN